MPGANRTRREVAAGRLKTVMPALFALGFLFYTGVTVLPLAGMPGPPLSPEGGVEQLLVWVAASSACGLLFALFGGMVVAVSAAPGD